MKKCAFLGNAGNDVHEFLQRVCAAAERNGRVGIECRRTAVGNRSAGEENGFDAARFVGEAPGEVFQPRFAAFSVFGKGRVIFPKGIAGCRGNLENLDGILEILTRQDPVKRAGRVLDEARIDLGTFAVKIDRILRVGHSCAVRAEVCRTCG